MTVTEFVKMGDLSLSEFASFYMVFSLFIMFLMCLLFYFLFSAFTRKSYVLRDLRKLCHIMNCPVSFDFVCDYYELTDRQSRKWKPQIMAILRLHNSQFGGFDD